MHSINEKHAYSKERIKNEQTFISVEVDPNSPFLVMVEGNGPFKYSPRLLIDLFGVLVDELGLDSLSKFLDEAIDIAKERLSNPALTEYHVQGRVKVNHNGACWVPRESV